MGGGGTILKWILRKKWVAWIGLIWLSSGASGGAVVKKVMNMWVPESVDGFLDWLRRQRLVRKDSDTHRRACQLLSAVCRTKC
jgi:hypothetical protein